MPHDYFDEQVAATYDDDLGEMGAAEAVRSAVDFLAELAAGGPVLELGIGTGRIAVPLAARGVAVSGIDLSEAMVARMRAKPGGAEIPVVIGDFASTAGEGTYKLAYLVFNTIMNLCSQDEQVACFVNVGTHLQPGGCFVVETGLPDLQRLPPGETFRPFTVTPTHLGIDEYDVLKQGLVSHHYRLQEGRVEQLSIPFRYVWPAELDLMAKLGGMRLRERWAGWRREPFTAESMSHVSVWEKTA